MGKSQGFTLLEMLVTIAIIAVVTAVTLPAYNSWTEGKSYRNTLYEIVYALQEMKNESLSRNDTTRVVIASTSSGYTITTYYSGSQSSTCSSSGSWTQIYSKTIDIPSTYQITGSGIDNTCFYRDGTSSGGTITIAPISGSGSGNAVITTTIATGYLDVVISN